MYQQCDECVIVYRSRYYDFIKITYIRIDLMAIVMIDVLLMVIFYLFAEKNIKIVRQYC